ncbi:hypothetical protein OEZ85_005250 [Tetradesmus obliquus]|uniref:Uncharacterized protein n=1 Tax=Tetradesmus obliquus TaxID=3088 RepID=A0ABY8UHS5_TETOB|nr:hypothetical protein OEZ85_005250 [Tetradesmus obliquus]
MESLQQQLQELTDSAAASADAQQQVQVLQQDLAAAQARVDEAAAATQAADAKVLEVEAQLAALQAEVQELQQQLTTADEAQTALTLQLLEKDQEVKLFAQNSGSASSWRLSAESNGGATPPAATVALESALAEARHQLGCWEQDVMALEFVAKHEAFDDICDLDMTYNNSHLDTIHRSVMQLRKSLADAASSSAAAADAQSTAAAPAAVAVASTSTGSSLPSSSLGRSSAAGPDLATSLLSPSSANASPRTKNALKFAALEAQANSATSRSLAVGSALDTSLQAMQAAKLSLMSMHDKDVKLELISQSVQEVLAGGKVGESAASSCGGAPSSAGASSAKASGGGVVAEASATSIPESLLAAKTLQEVEAIVARVFSSDGGSSAASGSTYGSNGGSNVGGSGVSRLSGTGARDSMPGAEDVAAESHLAAELERYKQQLQELQEAHESLMQLEVGTEQLMLPSTDSNTPTAGKLATRRPGQEWGPAGSDHQQDSVLRPLQEPLLSAMLPDQPMAQMLSSEHNEDMHSRPFSAEMETEYMHYSNTALMAQSLAEGSSRRPALPTTEEDADDAAGQQGSNAADASAPAAGTGAAAGSSSALSTGSSTGTGRRSSQLQSREYVVIIPGAAGDTSGNASTAAAGGVIASSATATSSGSRRMPAASQGGLEAQQLAQRVLDRLKKEEQGSTAGRGSWPGGIKDSKKSLVDLRSVAHDVTELTTISAELAQQQEAVQQQLAASQQLAEAMRQQAQAHNCSLDEVVGHFFNVYNIACFVASDRESVLDLLIEARSAQQNLSAQLDSRANQIQQLAADRDLALKKLCHSEEKLVALEGQLEVAAYVTSLAQRMAAMQSLTEHISSEVLRKHEEALALQASFMQVEVAKQLLEKQLADKSNESQLASPKPSASPRLPAAAAAAISSPKASTGGAARSAFGRAAAPDSPSVSRRASLTIASSVPASPKASAPASPRAAPARLGSLSASTASSRAGSTAGSPAVQAAMTAAAANTSKRPNGATAAAAAAASNSAARVVAAAAGKLSSRIPGMAAASRASTSSSAAATPAGPSALSAASSPVMSPRGGSLSVGVVDKSAPIFKSRAQAGPAAAPVGSGPARSAGSGSGGLTGAGGGSGSRGSSGSGGSAAAAAVGRMVRMLSGGGSRPMGGDSSSIMKSKSKDGKEPSRK